MVIVDMLSSIAWTRNESLWVLTSTSLWIILEPVEAVFHSFVMGLSLQWAAQASRGRVRVSSGSLTVTWCLGCVLTYITLSLDLSREQTITHSFPVKHAASGAKIQLATFQASSEHGLDFKASGVISGLHLFEWEEVYSGRCAGTHWREFSTLTFPQGSHRRTNKPITLW